jgi:MurNAc alpha-1-phosphate uridylyltransferase
MMHEMAFPKQAIVLAAGRGARFRPLTDTMPKPMVPLADKPLIDWQLEMLAAQGIERVVINCCYLKEQLMQHVRMRNYGFAEVIFSEEETALETGGGIKNARPYFENAPFFAINSDVVMVPSAGMLAALVQAMHIKPTVQAALLLQARVGIIGLHSAGDFFCDAYGRLARRGAQKEAPFVFTGVQLLHPCIFDGEDATIFSMNKIYDALLSTQPESHLLAGIVYQAGMMLHVGDMEGYHAAEQYLAHISEEVRVHS